MTEVSPTKYPPLKPEKITPDQVDIEFISKKFWGLVGPQYVSAYDRGIVFARLGMENPLELKEFMNRMTPVLKESLRIAYDKSERTTEELKNVFELIDLAAQLYAEKAEGIDLDINVLLAMMAGFIVAYRSGLPQV